MIIIFLTLISVVLGIDLHNQICTNVDMSKNYSGSGVLLVQFLNNEHYVWLFRNRQTGEFAETGRHMEIEDAFSPIALELTAMREVKEETGNVIDLYDSDILTRSPYIDHKYKNKFHRTYFVGLNLIDDYISKHYQSNRRIIDHTSLYLDDGWRATNGFGIFNLKSIQTCVGLSNCKFKVHSRIKTILESPNSFNVESYYFVPTIDEKLFDTVSYVPYY
jgi:hypothetical protein